MQSETKMVTVSKQSCRLSVNTNKHEDLNLMFANHRKEKEDGIYPLTTIEIAKHKRKITRSILKTCKTSKVDLHFQLIEDTIVLYKDENQSSQHLYE
jgi:hypothetical protein